MLTSMVFLLDNNYTWIIIVGVVVFVLVVIILLCFTKATGEPLFLGNIDDPELAGQMEETPALLALLSEDARLSYERAKVFQQRFPPDSIPTDISLSQYVSIQEKGVAAFEFDWDMETNTFISGRTELQFFHGECSLQTNLPLPRNQDVYYWEAKMYEKPRTTVVSVGVATKPYPNWRLPGWNRNSVGYFSDTGNKHLNNPFHGKAYALGFQEGDVVGVGYRHRSGTIFFTKNGRKLEDACTSLRWNLFPTIGANGPCQIHVNLGQMGFVFVEANVKKWGLAPMHGTLAAPPAYGFEAGSLLLERGSSGQRQQQQRQQQNYMDSENDEDDAQQPLIPVIRSTPQPTLIPQQQHHRSQLPIQSPPSYSTLPQSHFLTGYGSNGATTTLITTPTHDSP